MPGLHGLVTQRLDVSGQHVSDQGGAAEPAPATAGTSSVATATRASAPVTTPARSGIAIPVLVLVGVMCLRAAVIFSVT